MSFTGRGGSRSRRRHRGGWRVRSRVERFAEPAVLLLLKERPAHGYELTDTGRKLLDTWAESLRETQRRIGAFLERYERGKEVS